MKVLFYYLSLLILVLMHCRHTAQGMHQKYPIIIGALFFEDEIDLEKMFDATVKRINSESYNNFYLVPYIKRLSDEPSTATLQEETCDLIDNGVAAIFGPSSKADSDIVAVICNATGIPHILFDVTDELSPLDQLNHQLTVNLYPSLLMLSKAYADIVHNYGWKKFTIVYSADDALAPTRLQDLLQLRNLNSEIVRVRQYKRDEDYRIMWKSIRGERRIILDCEPDLLVELLNASTPFDLMGQFNHLLLTNLETHSANLEELRDNVTFGANVTAARLSLNGNFYNANYWQRIALYGIDPLSTELQRTLLPDLVYDAVSAFAQALRNITVTFPVNKPGVHCEFGDFSGASFNNVYAAVGDGSAGYGGYSGSGGYTTAGGGQSWAMGHFISRVLKATSGVNNTNFRSSSLQFDEHGQRANFHIEIYDPLDNYGYAVWDPSGRITPLHIEANITKKIIYRVATRIGVPYFMLNTTAVALNLTGNARYYGYAVDLIEALAQELKFEYVFVPVADNAYGNYDEATKQWNGIIGEIVYNDAHMGICDLTITQARKTVVDFTVPFMQLGISILAYKNPYEPKHVLAFLDPFGVEVWVYVSVAIFLVSFLLIFMARVSKEEWENPHPCNKDPEKLENKWHLSNTFWLTMGSIMTAGSDILPRSPPMRTFNAMWWIFAVIITNSYTANLAAFLTNSKMEGSITDIKDLAEQTKVKFGTLFGGSTYTFFADSNETVYRLAFNIMNRDDPSAYTKDNPEGVERVLKNRGGYMFLMETTTLEYNTERNCELRMVGEKFGEKHYAIAVPFGAEYRSNLSVALLKLSERGELFKLKTKWWKNHNVSCYISGNADGTPDLNFEEVRGIFYTLAIGVFLAMLLGLGEFLAHTHNIAVEEKMSFKEALVKETKFFLRIWNNKKPINTPTASIKSDSHRSSEKALKQSKGSSAGAGQVELDNARIGGELSELTGAKPNGTPIAVNEVKV